MDVKRMEQFSKMQTNCLDMMKELIAYDKEEALKKGEQPMNTKLVEAFIETQGKALNTFSDLLLKHKPALEAIEAKIQEEKNAKIKASREVSKIKADIKKAKTDEASLFCMETEPTAPLETEPTELDGCEEFGEYDFEEND